ncbi:hypothetical protein H9636_16045 [Ureibacillus sp. Re31]|uniref:Uncharacterized protein n=1 Tax=Ureibacillus galli TaxID=2762222 RepID=A0ABR8XG04_9BACL|nr:hypothetical protein [Ureibacillus galli]MBD8028160.1 hypothetical protein [Ureibacillus galli]
MEFEVRCTLCNRLANVDEEKSNENWKVYKNKCDKCGSPTTMKIKDDELPTQPEVSE